MSNKGNRAMNSAAVTLSQIRGVQALEGQLIDDLQLSVDADWVVVACELTRETAALEGIGRCGLWKNLTRSRIPRRVFELPLALVDSLGAGDAEGEEISSERDKRIRGLRRCVEWAVQTLGGSAPEGWIAPTIEEITAAVGSDLLTVQCGDVACRGRIVRTDSRLAIVFPIVAGISTNLPAPRKQRLEGVLAEAHHTFRMIRVGLSRDDDQTQSAIVEIDLTGAPPAIAAALARYAVDALHHVVRWSGASASLIVTESSCEILDH